MKRILKLLLMALGLCLATHELCAQGTTFTYQGRLNDNGSPANGGYDLSFRLFDALTVGNAVSVPRTNFATMVTNGLFTVSLDFSNAFNGNPRWLEIGVRTNGSASAFNLLAPRQALTPTPYAIFAGGSSNAVIATTITGSLPNTSLTGSYTNTVNLSSVSNSFTGNYFGNGLGLTNVPGGFLVWRLFTGTNLQALANTGYLITNAQFVNITLPDSTNISDILRVAGIGAGGWRISPRTNQTIFVNGLLGLVGANWTQRASSLNWTCIASSADGTKLAAAVSGGTIYTSTDSGATWTPHSDTVGNASWSGIASSTDGNRLVATITGAGGKFWTSADAGVNWVGRANIVNLTAVASSADGSRLVACVNGGLIYTSTDYGTNWLSRDSIRNWSSVASSDDGLKLAAAINTGQIYTSTNSGTNWTLRAGSPSAQWHSIASSGDGVKLAACAYGGNIYVSPDSGVTWVLTNSFTTNWSAVVMSEDGTKLAASVFNGNIWVSGNSGATWNTQSPKTNWLALASSADGSKLAAAVSTGFIYTSTPVVNTGTTNYITGGQGTAIELLSVGNGIFIPISFMGSIFAY